MHVHRIKYSFIWCKDNTGITAEKLEHTHGSMPFFNDNTY